MFYLSCTAATLTLHYISYLGLYRDYVAFPLIQKPILNMDLPTRQVGLQQLCLLSTLDFLNFKNISPLNNITNCRNSVNIICIIAELHLGSSLH
jgi:hypothetical protein